MPTIRHFTAFIGTAAAASALGLAALVSSGTAGASAIDDTFLSVLSDEGIQAPSTKEAISVAHDACAIFDDGLELVDAVSAVSDYTGLEMEDSEFFVGASVATYCLEHEGVISA